MMNYRRICMALLVLMTIGLFVMDVEAMSCYAGRAGCMSSCMAQNCATGYCSPAGAPASQQTCVCSRCNDGPNTPW